MVIRVFDYMLVTGMTRDKKNRFNSPRIANMEKTRELSLKMKSEMRSNFESMMQDLPFLTQDSHWNSGSDWNAQQKSKGPKNKSIATQ